MRYAAINVVGRELPRLHDAVKAWRHAQRHASTYRILPCFPKLLRKLLEGICESGEMMSDMRAPWTK